MLEAFISVRGIVYICMKTCCCEQIYRLISVLTAN